LTIRERPEYVKDISQRRKDTDRRDGLWLRETNERNREGFEGTRVDKKIGAHIEHMC